MRVGTGRTGAEGILARRRVLGDGHFDTMISASFALILSGLAADPKAREAMETLKAAWSQPGEGREPDSGPELRDQPGA